MMALNLGRIVSFSKNIFKAASIPSTVINQQVRNKWANNRMLKDYRKRLVLKRDGPERLRINSLRKNDILPVEIRELADQRIKEMPVDGSITRIIPRCALTSRPRGVIHRFRVSRIVFRHLADYNKLSGVQRAMW